MQNELTADLNATIPAPPPSMPPAFDAAADAWRGFGLLGYDDYKRQVLAAQGLSPMDLITTNRSA